MPATTLVCPHCEKTVEIQVSSVTRSRPCPECGQMVMLQMAEKTTKTKRRALLMTQNEPVSTPSPTPAVVVSHEPQALPGDAFDRMRMDPEIQRFRRRLLIGAIAVGVIVVLMVILSLLPSPAQKEKPLASESDKAGDSSTQSGGEMVHPPETSLTQAEEPRPQVNSGNLVFRPPGSGDLKTASVMPIITGGDLAKLAAAEEVLGKFLETPSWKQRILLVRDRLRVAPLMSIYYSKNADGPLAFDSIVEAKETSPKFTQHVVVFEGGGRRVATVEHSVAGPRVDWESFVGAGEMGWSDFLELKQASPTLFRVLVSPAGHFENQFGDPSKLQCYSLRNISEPGAKVVYGYAEKGGPIAKSLDYQLQLSEDATVPMTLRLKFPPDAPVDFQVWISQMVQAGWVTP
ncbi:hypothetical protein [Prosthecobacter sp.]|uniref:hypothetical protein n=1 Tax=Prosthecobacter sp. TaxID=1965333 RepID=UPI0024880472|nr:hypothetical protein [Prosthecobacter sp.]MDI1314461.1 hypothetical protein [Prosthecobacter sp.]